MKRRLQIVSLRVAIVALRIPLTFTSATTWRLESVRSQLQTKLASLEADEQRRTR